MPVLAMPASRGAAASDAAWAMAAELRSRLRSLVSELEIDVIDGGLVLYGRAYSYYGKQLAQEELRARYRARVRANCIQVESTGRW